MEDNKGNFLDSRTILAIVLVGAVWFGWQSYLNKKYPQIKRPVAEQNQKIGDSSGAPTSETDTAPKQATDLTPTTKPKVSVAEKRIKYENSNISFELSSIGMGFKNFFLKNHKDRKFNPIVLGVGDEESLFALGLVGEEGDLNFDITQKADNVFEGVAKRGDMTITRSFEIDPALNSFKTSILIQRPDAAFKGLSIALPEKLVQGPEKSLLRPSYEHQEFLVKHSGKTERVNITGQKSDYDADFGTVGVVAIGSQYFATAIVDKSDVIPEVKLKANLEKQNILAKLIYKPASMKDLIELKFTAYAGAKSLDRLEKIDKDMGDIVNLGFFSPIAKILLKVLYVMYGLVGNWGFAIILLTVMVRLLVLPFNITSYKSMKKMQTIQPTLKALREKYKDDPQALNKEMMLVMRDNKVNPIGGCLPMLLQMPVFFALYQCLGQSIELYQAPFVGWIHDLSLKDPLFILPVLMGISMFIQQKITPSTMDPAQAKIMQFLPIIFSLMMVSLPSGLTLYIFVSTLFGIIQQQIFMKDKRGASKAQTAKA